MKRKIAYALLVGLLLALGCGGFYLNQKTALADELLRLHVIANSDSVYDQQVKLEIRDALLDYLSADLQEAADRDQAIDCLAARLPQIEEYCREQLAPLAAYDVHLELGKAYFPLRSYGALTAPAGEYQALKVVLGEGAGKNWWCVLFPPLCFIEGTSKWEAATVSAGEAAKQGEISVRWKAGEIFDSKD